MTIQALSSTDLQKLDDGLKKALGNPPATVTAAISAGDIEMCIRDSPWVLSATGHPGSYSSIILNPSPRKGQM